ncbi:hypothetical protein VNO80_06560 [Phaseolus coccineus]|uniref:Uncharacterized protein n=1 Tax=Phaseolus coccineus TaxID=3886 RepID=A0AAN9NLW1_PHACN
MYIHLKRNAARESCPVANKLKCILVMSCATVEGKKLLSRMLQCRSKKATLINSGYQGKPVVAATDTEHITVSIDAVVTFTGRATVETQEDEFC